MRARAMRFGSALMVIGSAITSCAAPMTQSGAVSKDVVKMEQFKQQQLVVQSGLNEQKRLEDIGYPLLQAARGLCGDRVAARTGVRVANVYAFSKEYQPAARSLGFSDTLVVAGVAKGSAAERAGVAVGDRLVGLGGGSLPVGTSAVKDFTKRMDDGRYRTSDVNFVVRRGTLGLAGPPQASAAPVPASGSTLEPVPATVSVAIAPDTVCAFGLVSVKDDLLNAWADGKNVYLTTAMMRFAADDDELAVVVAHEIAHDAMRHIDAKKKNAVFGAILGAALDVAAASQGVNTGGDFSRHGAEAGSMVFSQDFEREADYVGLYILARANRAISNAPNFWRRMAQESPGSIKFASSHPTTAERFVRLEQTVAEIQKKQAEGMELAPEMKKPDDNQ